MASKLGKFCLLISAVAIALLPQPSGAVAITFHLDPTASRLEISSTLVSVSGQDPNGTTTTYHGSIRVDVDDLFSPTSIQFLHAAAIADNGGDYRPQAPGTPGNSGPANYGVGLAAGFTSLAAVRDLEISFTSELESIHAGMFASTQSAEVTSGRTDELVLVPFLVAPASCDPFLIEAGCVGVNLATEGSYTVDGNLATLTLPMLLHFPIEAELATVLEGTLVGVAVVAEPASGAQASLTAIVALMVLVRTRRRMSKRSEVPRTLAASRCDVTRQLAPATVLACRIGIH
jgi:hypothetical protein